MPIQVSPDNFIRAESDLYFGNLVKDGGFGAFHHIRELSPIDNQLVIGKTATLSTRLVCSTSTRGA